MNEDHIRALVRESIARRLAGHAAAAEPDPAQPLPVAWHASHFRYQLPGSGGACLIEPAVQCIHCGYCQSHGY